jgi:hypothetical protein
MGEYVGKRKKNASEVKDAVVTRVVSYTLHSRQWDMTREWVNCYYLQGRVRVRQQSIRLGRLQSQYYKQEKCYHNSVFANSHVTHKQRHSYNLPLTTMRELWKMMSPLVWQKALTACWGCCWCQSPSFICCVFVVVRLLDDCLSDDGCDVQGEWWKYKKAQW